MEYLVAFILAFVGIFLNKKMTSSVKKIYLGIILAYVILLLGFRYRVGVDTISYMMAYKHVHSLNHFFSSNIFSERYEPGYLFVCSFCRTFFGKEFWPVQMIMAAITNGCIFIFLYRYCRNVFVGICIFFLLQWFYFSTDIIRESAAIGIFLLNYRNIEKKRWLLYYIFSLFSISFHYSAIIIWAIPLATYLKPNFLYIVVCVSFIAITPIVEFLNNFLPTSSISSRIDQYLAISDLLNLNWKIGESIRSALPTIAVLIAYRIVKTKISVQPMLLLQILFCCGAFAIPIVFSRFANYTALFTTVAIANFICTKQFSKWLRTSLLCFILMTQTYYYYTMYPRWFPYVSIFNPKQINEREQIWKVDFIYNHW